MYEDTNVWRHNIYRTLSLLLPPPLLSLISPQKHPINPHIAWPKGNCIIPNCLPTFLTLANSISILPVTKSKHWGEKVLLPPLFLFSSSLANQPWDTSYITQKFFLINSLNLVHGLWTICVFLRNISLCLAPLFSSLSPSVTPTVFLLVAELLFLKIIPILKNFQRIPVIHRIKSRFHSTTFNAIHDPVSIYSFSKE